MWPLGWLKFPPKVSELSLWWVCISQSRLFSLTDNSPASTVTLPRVSLVVLKSVFEFSLLEAVIWQPSALSEKSFWTGSSRTLSGSRSEDALTDFMAGSIFDQWCANFDLRPQWIPASKNNDFRYISKTKKSKFFQEYTFPWGCYKMYDFNQNEFIITIQKTFKTQIKYPYIPNTFTYAVIRRWRIIYFGWDHTFL